MAYPAVEVLRLSLDFIRPREKVRIFSGPSADLHELADLFGLRKKDVPDAVLYHFCMFLPQPTKNDPAQYFPFEEGTTREFLDPLLGSDDSRRGWFREARKFMRSDYQYDMAIIYAEMAGPTASPDIVYDCLKMLSLMIRPELNEMFMRFSTKPEFARCLHLAVVRVILDNLAWLRMGNQSSANTQDSIRPIMNVALRYGFDIGFDDNIFFESLHAIWKQIDKINLDELALVHRIFGPLPNVQDDAEMKQRFMNIQDVLNNHKIR